MLLVLRQCCVIDLSSFVYVYSCMYICIRFISRCFVTGLCVDADPCKLPAFTRERGKWPRLEKNGMKSQTIFICFLNQIDIALMYLFKLLVVHIQQELRWNSYKDTPVKRYKTK